MSLLRLSKRILGKRDTPAVAARNKKQTVDTTALHAGMVGLIQIISEKAIRKQEQGIAVFRVSPNVPKGRIASIIASRYGVTVKHVRTLQMSPKNRRRGISEGKTNTWKKAYVTVDNIAALTQKA